MKKILVTGGSGKIGTHFIRRNLEKYKITVFDRKELSINHKNLTFMEGDLSEKEHLIASMEGVDVLIHLAANANPDEDMEGILAPNIIGTTNVFYAGIEANCDKIIFASSAQTIEGYEKDMQVYTDMPVKPGNFYGVSKVFGEALLSCYCSNTKVRGICLRIGAYEFPRDHTEMNARDMSAFLHPDDFNQALEKCIEDEKINFEIFNIISNNTYKRLDITKTKDLLNYLPAYNSFDLFTLKK